MKKSWSHEATKLFKGKIVERIGYLNEMECEAMDWQPTPFIEFTDGHSIIASCDDEGNEGGVFYTSMKEMSIIPRGGN